MILLYKIGSMNLKQEQIIPKLGSTPNRRSQILVHILLIKAKLVEHTHQEPVLLLCIVLALVGAVPDAQLVERRLVAGNLGVQGLLDQGTTLDTSLTLLNLTDNPKAKKFVKFKFYFSWDLKG